LICLALSLVIVERKVLSAPFESQWISGTMVSPVTSQCRYMSPWASRVASEQARYSASVEDLPMTVCSFDFHEIGALAILKR